MTNWDDVDFGGITCREFVELVTEYLEDQLDDQARRRFEQHVAACPGCSRYLDQIRAATRALGHVSLDGLISSTEQPKTRLCRACFDGEYPTDVPVLNRARTDSREAAVEAQLP